MELLDALYTRRSVRKYKDQPIPRELIKKLIDSAVAAPSAMNAQPWAFLVIENQTTLKDLSDKSKSLLLGAMEDNPRLARYRGLLSNPDFNIFYQAPAVIVVLAKPSGPHASEDCALAAQNLMLAAHDLGLGTCWIGFALAALSQPEIKQRLSIPDDYVAVAPIVLGYPEIMPPSTPRSEPEIVDWIH